MSIASVDLAHKPQNDPHAGGIPILLNIGGKQRTTGFAMPNGYWYRRMEGSRAFLRKPTPAIAAGKPAMAEAERLGCVAAKVVDAETGDTYLATFDVIRRYGVTIQRAGWEPQIALALAHWHIIRRDGTQVLPAHERQAATPVTNPQLELFQAVTE